MGSVTAYHDGGEWFDTTGMPLADDYVTHWAEMPEAPR